MDKAQVSHAGQEFEARLSQNNDLQNLYLSQDWLEQYQDSATAWNIESGLPMRLPSQTLRIRPSLLLCIHVTNAVALH